MADQAHLEKLLGEVDAWNYWRGKNPLIKPLLRGANLKGANLQKYYLHGADLRGAVLRGADLQKADLREANLEEADLQGANLGQADLREADLRAADLRGADLHGAILHNADLSGAILRGAILRGAELYGVNFLDAVLQGAALQESIFRTADLHAVDLHGTNLRGAKLRGANLRGANLRDAVLQGVALVGADLQDADLQDADLEDANLEKTIFQEANLVQAKLRGAYLRGANLQRAKLQIANLEGADLQGANLEGANLQKGNLQQSNLQGANLQKSDLREAELRGADLRGANLRGANLRGANLQKGKLQQSNLQGADLQKASLKEANLERAILIDANLLGADLGDAQFRGIYIGNNDVSLLPGPIRKQYGDTFYVLGVPDSPLMEFSIIRSIEFPPEYHQAGVSILNYFGTVLRQKYPDKKVKVRIEQEGLKVTMIVETDEGDREIIEEALDKYGLVITGKMPIKEYTQDPVFQADLRNQVIHACAIIESQRNIIALQGGQLQEQKRTIDRFFGIVETGISRPTVINVSASSSSAATANSQVNIYNSISLIRDRLNDLREQLQDDSQARQVVKEIQAGLKGMKPTSSPEEVKKSPAMSKLKNFLQGIEKTGSKTGKVLKGIRDGVKVTQDLAEVYNSIAQWCGLPQVPKPFLKKEKK